VAAILTAIVDRLVGLGRLARSAREPAKRDAGSP
jgi:hypothetical protein